ncbi:MAG: hypothetical protein MOB07_28055, partial [Acidobacteria bacterium]|nr:hypothetical protein [Acidobacteriota bacterium]
VVGFIMSSLAGYYYYAETELGVAFGFIIHLFVLGIATVLFSPLEKVRARRVFRRFDKLNTDAKLAVIRYCDRRERIELLCRALTDSNREVRHKAYEILWEGPNSIYDRRIARALLNYEKYTEDFRKHAIKNYNEKEEAICFYCRGTLKEDRRPKRGQDRRPKRGLGEINSVINDMVQAGGSVIILGSSPYESEEYEEYSEKRWRGFVCNHCRLIFCYGCGSTIAKPCPRCERGLEDATRTNVANAMMRSVEPKVMKAAASDEESIRSSAKKRDENGEYTCDMCNKAYKLGPTGIGQCPKCRRMLCSNCYVKGMGQVMGIAALVNICPDCKMTLDPPPGAG